MTRWLDCRQRPDAGTARRLKIPRQIHLTLPIVFVIIDSYILYCTFVQLSMIILYFLKCGCQQAVSIL